jgi:hypothetical protein
LHRILSSGCPGHNSSRRTVSSGKSLNGVYLKSEIMAQSIDTGLRHSFDTRSRLRHSRRAPPFCFLNCLVVSYTRPIISRPYGSQIPRKEDLFASGSNHPVSVIARFSRSAWGLTRHAIFTRLATAATLLALAKTAGDRQLARSRWCQACPARGSLK